VTNSQSFSNKPSSQPSATSATVGGLLRETRKRAGVGIADVARALRISQKYLEALEDDRHADLPGAAYAIGFVRSYGEHLHLDGEEVVRRYKVEAAGLNGKKDLVFPKPMSDSGVPGGAVLGLGVIFAALAYGMWYWNSTEDGVDAARVETVPEYMASVSDKASAATPEAASATPEDAPESLSETAPETAVVAEATSELASKGSMTPESPEEISSPQDNAEDVPVQAMKKQLAEVDAAPKTEVQMAERSSDAVGDIVDQAPAAPAKEPLQIPDSLPLADKAPPASARAETAPVTPAPAVDTPTVPQSVVSAPTGVAPASTEPVPTQERQNEGPSRITVHALSNSWIQVRDEVADRLLFTRLLRKGDEYKVPNRSGLRLMTGNAGALELRVDDVAAPSIGAIGEVRRSVELDVDKLKAGTAVSE
jgi:cytoskeleton protein RodZ